MPKSQSPASPLRSSGLKSLKRRSFKRADRPAPAFTTTYGFLDDLFVRALAVGVTPACSNGLNRVRLGLPSHTVDVATKWIDNKFEDISQTCGSTEYTVMNKTADFAELNVALAIYARVLRATGKRNVEDYAANGNAFFSFTESDGAGIVWIACIHPSLDGCGVPSTAIVPWRFLDTCHPDNPVYLAEVIPDGEAEDEAEEINGITNLFQGSSFDGLSYLEYYKRAVIRDGVHYSHASSNREMAKAMGQRAGRIAEAKALQTFKHGFEHRCLARISEREERPQEDKVTLDAARASFQDHCSRVRIRITEEDNAKRTRQNVSREFALAQEIKRA